MDKAKPSGQDFLRHLQRLFSRCIPDTISIIVFYPSSSVTCNGNDHKTTTLLNKYVKQLNLYIVYYGYPYCVIPMELDDVYPLGQTEISFPVDEESKAMISTTIKRYITAIKYRHLIFFVDRSLVTEETLHKIRDLPRAHIFDAYDSHAFREFKNYITQLRPD